MSNSAAQLRYDAANIAYSEGKFQDALSLYEAAIQSSPAEEHDLNNRCMLNKAQCFSKLRQFEDAVSELSVLISKTAAPLPSEPVLSKALIRRAMYQEFLGNYASGIADLNKALCMKGLNTALAKVALNSLSKFKVALAKDEIVISTEGRPAMLLNAQQALRFNFLNSIPDEVSLGELFHIRLCIGNELGLWDQRRMNTKDSNSVLPHLVCNMIYIESTDATTDHKDIGGDSLQLDHSTVRMEFVCKENVALQANGKVCHFVAYFSCSVLLLS
jgi:hypothetical protein